MIIVKLSSKGKTEKPVIDEGGKRMMHKKGAHIGDALQDGTVIVSEHPWIKRIYSVGKKVN